MSRQLLFICTGNICRSPMAAALLRNLLPHDTPWRVASAGLAAMAGNPASCFAQQAVMEYGGDLSAHRSRQLTTALVTGSDLILVMTAQHKQVIHRCFPEGLGKVRMLGEIDQGGSYIDISDPYGGTLDDYRECRDAIQRFIPKTLALLSNV